MPFIYVPFVAKTKTKTKTQASGVGSSLMNADGSNTLLCTFSRARRNRPTPPPPPPLAATTDRRVARTRCHLSTGANAPPL